MAYNEAHGITPKTIWRSQEEIMEQTSIADRMAKPVKMYAKPEEQVLKAADPLVQFMPKEQLQKMKDQLQKEMEKAARELDFPLAAKLRDEIIAIDYSLTNG